MESDLGDLEAEMSRGQGIETTGILVFVADI